MKMGALTSKPAAFVARPWEVTNIDSYDLLNPNVKISYSTRDSRMIRVKRKTLGFISNTLRFSPNIVQRRFIQPLISLSIVTKKPFFKRFKAVNKLIPVKSLIGILDSLNIVPSSLFLTKFNIRLGLKNTGLSTFENLTNLVKNSITNFTVTTYKQFFYTDIFEKKPLLISNNMLLVYNITKRNVIENTHLDMLNFIKKQDILNISKGKIQIFGDNTSNLLIWRYFNTKDFINLNILKHRVGYNCLDNYLTHPVNLTGFYNIINAYTIIPFNTSWNHTRTDIVELVMTHDYTYISSNRQETQIHCMVMDDDLKHLTNISKAQVYIPLQKHNNLHVINSLGTFVTTRSINTSYPEKQDNLYFIEQLCLNFALVTLILIFYISLIFLFDGLIGLIKPLVAPIPIIQETIFPGNDLIMETQIKEYVKKKFIENLKFSNTFLTDMLLTNDLKFFKLSSGFYSISFYEQPTLLLLDPAGSYGNVVYKPPLCVIPPNHFVFAPAFLPPSLDALD